LANTTGFIAADPAMRDLTRSDPMQQVRDAFVEAAPNLARAPTKSSQLLSRPQREAGGFLAHKAARLALRAPVAAQSSASLRLQPQEGNDVP